MKSTGNYFIIKNKMKLLVSIALFIAMVSAEASSACLYCRRVDQGAGLLVTFSYCNQTDECLQNQWNYITRDCTDGWVRGNSYELDYCQPLQIECPEFTSNADKFQQYTNKTWSLGQGASCIVRVNATDAVARVIFENSNYLGIEMDGKSPEVGDVITIPETSVAEILIYNGAENGPLTFDISFSGAVQQLMAFVATVALTAILAV